MRISKDLWALELAGVTAKRSTCLRRAVGCVLLDAKGRVLATGYNGVPAGQPHCNELSGGVRELAAVDYMGSPLRTKAPKAFDGQPIFKVVPWYQHACKGSTSPSGTNLDACHAIHAEQNALLQCKDVDSIDTCYTTVSPCITCLKMLLNTSCRRLVFSEQYAQAEHLELWTQAGRTYELNCGEQNARMAQNFEQGTYSGH